jgi:hypothetical protein
MGINRNAHFRARPFDHDHGYSRVGYILSVLSDLAIAISITFIILGVAL